MLAFILIFGFGVAALLLLQEMDIENVRPRRPVAAKPVVRTAKAKIAFFNGENAAR